MIVGNPFVEALVKAIKNNDPNQEQLRVDWAAWNKAFLNNQENKQNPFGFWEEKKEKT